MLNEWINVKRTYSLEDLNSAGIFTNKYYVTENNTAIDEIVPGIDLSLRPHQRYTVAAMLGVETKQYCNILYSTDELTNFKVETRAGVLSEKPSSGKTIEILALIALNPVPKKSMEITSLPFPRTIMCSQRDFNTRHSFENAGIGMEIKRTYTKVLKPTLIFVGRSVISQWKEMITKHTQFKLLVIDDIFALRQLYETWKESTNKINNYDIILVKNGIISGKFNPPELKGTTLIETKSRSIVALFSYLFSQCCFARVVFDDYDSLNIPTITQVIPALFTWFVSATKRAMPMHRNNVSGYKNITNINQIGVDHLLTKYRPHYSALWFNKELFTFFNVGCTNEFIDRSMNASIINYYAYRYRNPNNNYIDMIRIVASQQSTATNIIEMLNGDAIHSAAELAGIKTDSVPAIFAKMLGATWNNYRHSITVLAYIVKVKEYLESLAEDQLEIPSASFIDELNTNLKRPGPMSMINKIKYNHKLITDTIKEVETTTEQVKQISGLAIQRVKDNLRQGDCPITGVPLAEIKSIVIVKCCGIAIDANIISWGLRIVTQENDVSGSCPNCRQAIKFTDLIYIDQDQIKYTNILDDNNAIEAEKDEEPVKNMEVEIGADEIDEDEIDEDENMEEDNSTKFNAIIKLIKGQTLPERINADNMKLDTLLSGNYDLGTAEQKDRKFLIFANHHETLNKIEKKLLRARLPFLRIKGTVDRIKEVIYHYSLPNSDCDSINILLVNGIRYCAGTNLQMTTDLIFAHRVLDRNLETQIAGRAARYGRTNNLNIHWFVYDNEVLY